MLQRLRVIRERFGDAGVRDPDFICREFEPGTPGPGACESDGHYLCAECVHYVGDKTPDHGQGETS